MKKVMLIGLLSVGMSFSALAQGQQPQAPAPMDEYTAKLSPLERSELESKRKDFTILSQQYALEQASAEKRLEALRQQFDSANQTFDSYLATVKKAHNFPADLQYDKQNGRFAEQPKQTAPPKPTEKSTTPATTPTKK